MTRTVGLQFTVAEHGYSASNVILGPKRIARSKVQIPGDLGMLSGLASCADTLKSRSRAGEHSLFLQKISYSLGHFFGFFNRGKMPGILNISDSRPANPFGQVVAEFHWGQLII